MVSFSSSTIFKRRKRVLELTSNSEYTAVLATTPENIFYLSGYWGEGFLLLNGSEAYLIVPKLEFERASASALDVNLIRADRGHLMYEKLKEISKGKIVYVDNPPVDKFSKITNSVKQVKSIPDIFYKARMVKDEEEVDRLFKGGVIMKRALSKAKEVIRPGLTEQFVAAEIAAEIMRSGANPIIYHSTISPIIVASGPNSAYPHAEPTNRVIQKGDFVVVDIVLRFEGYVVDATRTFHVGPASDKEFEVYQAVLEAQRRGIEAISLGKTFGEIDKACRSYLAKVDFDEFFVHSTGHGIGIEVHEPPWIGPGKSERLERGMAFTIEPGVYLPGKYGVRIEDSIIMLDRPSVLTEYTKSLEEL